MELSNITLLGEAREFLESFDWTDDALRDFQSVNTERTHIRMCGLEVSVHI